MQLNLEPELLNPITQTQDYESIKDDFKVKEIIKDCRDKYLAKHPDVPFDESSPLYEMACIFIYREILLRSRMNDVCKKHIEFLKKIQSEKRKPFGLKQYYIDEAINFPSVQIGEDGPMVGIRDATGTKYPGGMIELSILADNEDGNPPDELVSKFQEYINRDDVKEWNDTIRVAKIKTIGVEIQVQAKPIYGTQIDPDHIRDKFLEVWEKTNRLGRSRSRSWITSKFHSDNVDEIIIGKISLTRGDTPEELDEDENIAIKPNEWAYLIKDKIKVTRIEPIA